MFFVSQSTKIFKIKPFVDHSLCTTCVFYPAFVFYLVDKYPCIETDWVSDILDALFPQFLPKQADKKPTKSKIPNHLGYPKLWVPPVIIHF